MSPANPLPEKGATLRSVGDAFPAEQLRLRELIEEYRTIGPAGTFGRLMIEGTLRRADAAMASGDIVQILRAFTEMQACK